jgi:hypothetical protein
LKKIINRLSEKNVAVKIQPSILDILAGSVKTSNVLGAPLIDLHMGLIPEWQQNIKRVLDVVAAFLSLVFLSPLLFFVAIRVRSSSKGSVLFSQERIGYKGKPFIMYKFRSMYPDAEDKGPALSSDNDPRITPWGRIMRKWRLGRIATTLEYFKRRNEPCWTKTRKKILYRPDCGTVSLLQIFTESKTRAHKLGNGSIWIRTKCG